MLCDTRALVSLLFAPSSQSDAIKFTDQSGVTIWYWGPRVNTQGNFPGWIWSNLWDQCGENTCNPQFPIMDLPSGQNTIGVLPPRCPPTSTLHLYGNLSSYYSGWLDRNAMVTALTDSSNADAIYKPLYDNGWQVPVYHKILAPDGGWIDIKLVGSCPQCKREVDTQHVKVHGL